MAITVRNKNEAYGMPVDFHGHTEADAVAEMQNTILRCGDEFADVVVTSDDYDVIED